MAKKIIEKMQYGSIFVEGFCATSIISLTLDEQFDRHYCFDLNPYIINFWKVLQKEPGRLYKFLSNVEYSEENFERAKEHIRCHEDDPGDPFFDAAMFFCVNRMSRSADGKTYGWSDRLRRGLPEYISSFKSAVDNLTYISDRIKHIWFYQGNYMDLMIECQLNEEENLVQYLDPPYPAETRVSKKSYGKYEMPLMCADSKEGELAHECLLDWCKYSMAGKTYLSSYNSPLYTKKLQGYPKYEWTIANSSSQQKSKPRKCEVLWEI